MISPRKIATITGILFIIATFFLFIGEAFYKPILTADNYLEMAHPQRNTLILGVLLEFICVLAMPLIPVFLFPLLRKFNEPLALAYLVFRFFEGIILIAVAEVNKLSLINLSEQYLNGGNQEILEQAGIIIQSMNYWADTTGMVYNLIFIIGTYVINIIFIKTKLIPRFISIWGLIGASTLFIAVILSVFSTISTSMEIVLIIPIAVQEMVMALWLIIKGFNPSIISSISDQH